MFTATVKGNQRFGEITANVEKLVKVALLEAARTAETVAQAGSSLDLKLEERGPVGTADGYSAGIKSRAKSSSSSAPIAQFFNDGTLGKRTKRLKRPRRDHWQTSRGTAHRGDVTGKGIEPERFFQKARSAGRKTLVERISRGL